LPVVRVYAPLGPNLIDYLSRIARYNRRPQAATDWRLDVHAGPDFLDRMREEPSGGVAIFSGHNRGEIDRIIAALEAGLQVLTDARDHRARGSAAAGGGCHIGQRTEAGVGRHDDRHTLGGGEVSRN
jgi:hypothetical protein